MGDEFQQAAGPTVLCRPCSRLPLRSTLIVLGLSAPLASHAANLDLAGVNRYASQEQVTSIS